MPRLVLLTLLLLSLGTAGANTLRWVGQRDPLGMDPHRQLVANAGFLLNIYEGLVRRSPNLTLEPALAERWEALPEGQGWRFFLRQGVRFHNGQDFTADDVLYSFQRARQEAALDTLLGTLSQVVVVDEHTVDLLTHQPNPMLPEELSLWYILDREWGEAMDSTAAMAGPTAAGLLANGTGPFLLARYQPGETMILEANPHWWDEPAHNLQRVEYRPEPDPLRRGAALLDGEADLVAPLPLEAIRQLQVLGDFRVISGGDLRVMMLGFHHGASHLQQDQRPNPLRDRRVRQALALGIDLEALNQQAMGGMAIPTGTVLAPEVAGFSPRLGRPIPADPDTARALLAEAEIENLRLELICPADFYLNDTQLCEALVPMLAAIGVELVVENLPPADYANRLRQGAFDLYLVGARPPSFNGEEMLRLLLRSPDPENPGPWNFGGYSDPTMDTLITSLGAEMDRQRRSQGLTQALGQLREEMLYIPLIQLPQIWAVRDGIQVFHRADAAVCLRWITMP